MGVLMVLLLAVVWAAFLLPGAVRAHRDGSPLSSVDAFRRSMAQLGESSASPEATGTAPAGRLRGRRVAAVVLLLATAALSVAGALLEPALWWGAGGCAVVLGGYLALLVQLRARRDETRRKVRAIPQRPDLDPAPTPSGLAVMAVEDEQEADPAPGAATVSGG